MWGARAIHEYEFWPVTAFGTFTLSVENHLELDNRARLRLWDAGVSFDHLSEVEMFTERAREFGNEVTRWIKRIRQGRDGRSPTFVRYLLVAERHDSDKTGPELRGRPHFHMLLHDMQAGCAMRGSPAAALAQGKSFTECSVEAGEWEVRNVVDKKGVWRPHVFLRDEAFIRKNWTLGFTKFQWAEDANSAWYVCKYLSKEMRCRVRASQRYGSPETISFGNTSKKGNGVSITKSEIGPQGESRGLSIR